MDEYQLTIRTLSDRIVAAQTPIRVLDAVTVSYTHLTLPTICSV